MNAILANAITNWRVATRLERAGGLPEKRTAYVRASHVDLVTHSALLLGGMDWARTVGVCRLAEPYADYLTNLDAEKAARGD